MSTTASAVAESTQLIDLLAIPDVASAILGFFSTDELLALLRDGPRVDSLGSAAPTAGAAVGGAAASSSSAGVVASSAGAGSVSLRSVVRALLEQQRELSLTADAIAADSTAGLRAVAATSRAHTVRLACRAGACPLPLLRTLHALPSLRRLDILHAPEVGHLGLLAIGGLPGLEEVRVRGVRTLHHAPHGPLPVPAFARRLRVLDVGGSSVTRCWPLHYFPGLQSFTGRFIDPAALLELVPAVPTAAAAAATGGGGGVTAFALAAGAIAAAAVRRSSLTALELHGSRICPLRIHTREWAALLAGLESLALIGCDVKPRAHLQQADWAVVEEALTTARRLKHLTLAATTRPAVGDDFMRHCLAAAPPCLESFVVRDAAFAGDVTLRAAAASSCARGLKRLVIETPLPQFSDRGLSALAASATSLQTLRLPFASGITDDGLQSALLMAGSGGGRSGAGAASVDAFTSRPVAALGLPTSFAGSLVDVDLTRASILLPTTLALLGHACPRLQRLVVRGCHASAAPEAIPIVCDDTDDRSGVSWTVSDASGGVDAVCGRGSRRKATMLISAHEWLRRRGITVEYTPPPEPAWRLDVSAWGNATAVSSAVAPPAGSTAAAGPAVAGYQPFVDVSVPCRYGCGSSVLSLMMADHALICGHAPMHCYVGCGEQYQRMHAAAHLLVCSAYVVACPVPGCVTQHPRGAISRHLQRDHVDAADAAAFTVHCPQLADGCGVRVSVAAGRHRLPVVASGLASGGNGCAAGAGTTRPSRVKPCTFERHLAAGRCVFAQYVCASCGCDAGQQRRASCGTVACAAAGRVRGALPGLMDGGVA